MHLKKRRDLLFEPALFFSASFDPARRTPVTGLGSQTSNVGGKGTIVTLNYENQKYIHCLIFKVLCVCMQHSVGTILKSENANSTLGSGPFVTWIRIREYEYLERVRSLHFLSLKS
jgi:hypothetical protein